MALVIALIIEVVDVMQAKEVAVIMSVRKGVPALHLLIAQNASMRLMNVNLVKKIASESIALAHVQYTHSSSKKQRHASPVVHKAATLGTCHDLTGTCHDLTGTCHDLTGTCHDLTGTCHDLTGTCHDLAGTCHDLTGTCHDLTGTCHDLTGTCHNYD
ncbi:uncharacterized protein [Watersipora subatra]|uniref:uncharacterized protein n=1 Tax=Watersipora subatra TaxID=2589382 RepID=UPI00355B5EB2